MVQCCPNRQKRNRVKEARWQRGRRAGARWEGAAQEVYAIAPAGAREYARQCAESGAGASGRRAQDSVKAQAARMRMWAEVKARYATRGTAR